jgi:hypothetical protein
MNAVCLQRVAALSIVIDRPGSSLFPHSLSELFFRLNLMLHLSSMLQQQSLLLVLKFSAATLFWPLLQKEEQAAGQVSSALKGEVLSAYRLKDATKVPPPPAADGETALQQLQRQKDRPHKLVLLNSVCSSTEEWVGFGSISSGIDLLVEVSVPLAHSEDIADSRPPTAHASVIPLVYAVAAADSGDNRGWNDTKLGGRVHQQVAYS